MRTGSLATWAVLTTLACSLCVACSNDSDSGDDRGGDSDSGGGGGVNPPPDPGDDTLDFDEPTEPSPPLAPALASLTYVGGGGDQYASSVRVGDDGSVTVSGEGWTLTWSADEWAMDGPGTLDGDVEAIGEEPGKRPALPGSPGRAYADPRIGLTFTVGYRQAGGNLQMPIFRAFEDDERIWALWGHAVADAEDRSLGADTRCYQAWGMPEGRIGVQCWTDGGNSVLAKDPRDLDADPTWNEGSWQRSAGGMSSLLALVDPSDGGRVVSGTFLNSHVSHLTVDPWGRVYLGRTATSRDGGNDPTDAFGLGASGGAGLLAFDENLQQPLLNARIGGTCDDGEEFFNALVVHEGVLLMAGTTCASDLITTNAVQADHGGGQDAMIARVRLW